MFPLAVVVKQVEDCMGLNAGKAELYSTISEISYVSQSESDASYLFLQNYNRYKEHSNTVS